MRPLESAGSPGVTPVEGAAQGSGQGWPGRLCALPANRPGAASRRCAPIIRAGPI